MRPYSRVKDIPVPIYNYQYFHRPSGEKRREDDTNHIDRRFLSDTVLDLLSTKIFAGVYLITGFRGSGKTSLVKKCIREFIRKQGVWQKVWQKHFTIETNLSGSNLSSFEVLKNITWAVNSHYATIRWVRWWRYLWMVLVMVLSYVLLSYTVTVESNRIHLMWSKQQDNPLTQRFSIVERLLEWNFSEKQKTVNPELKNVETNHLQVTVENTQPDSSRELSVHLYLLLLLALMYLAVKLVMDFLMGVVDIDIFHRHNFARLKRLNKRISSNETHAQASLKMMHADLTGDKKISYKDLTEKEITFELQQIIENAHRRKLFEVRFIFIIDELDKLEMSPDASTATASDQVKKKKDRIFQLLGELKQFFVSTKAKFFCITGAEMHDASLADITERDSYLGSIFHRVIYVPSFFSDFNNHSADITSLTERFVSQFLSGNERCTSLHEYFRNHYPENPLFSDNQNKAKRYYLLHSFIGFIAFRAKGSPKRIVSLFEENLYRKEDFLRAFDNEDKGIYLEKAEWKRYLEDESCTYVLLFDEFDQYKIGLNSVLISPFLYSYSLFITNHSDKLIISSAFLWDHVHKYHNAAFSANHLEYIHELISSSKDPETKKQLTFLLTVLKGRCVREIRSGLFDYTFTGRLQNEISFLSNVIQTESAVYNFTLDEASSLKLYYQAKLTEARKRLTESREKNPFLTGFLARTVGDLFFYDQEYDQAIIYYEEALSAFYQKDRTKLSSGEMVNMIRWLLLLSLTYEKCGHYTKAFAICCDINQEIKHFRDKVRYETHEQIIKYSKVFHQNAIQKLVLIEKTGLNGLQLSDIESACKELWLIYNSRHSYPVSLNDFSLGTQENKLIETEIFHNMNNIMFYRNTIDGDELLGNRDDEESIVSYALVAQRYLFNINRILNQRVSYYKEGELLESVRALISSIDLKKMCNDKANVNYALACADYLSKAGNAFIAGYKGNREAEFFRCLSDEKLDKGMAMSGVSNDLRIAHVLYHTSANILVGVGNYGDAAEQLLKILYVIRNISGAENTGLTYAERYSVCDYCLVLTRRILEYQHKKDDKNSRIFLQKYKHAMRDNLQPDSLSAITNHDELFTIFKSLSSSHDTSETVLVFLEAVFNFEIEKFDKLVAACMKNVNENAVIKSQFVRLMELSFKAQYNFRSIKKSPLFGSADIFESPTGCPDLNQDDYEYLYQVVNDSIYCLLEALRITSVQRNDFMIGYSVSASMYWKLAMWSTARKALLHFAENDESLLKITRKYEIDLNNLIHSQNVVMGLSAKYNYEKALDDFGKVEQTHNRGASYKEFMHRIYALEDDMNDEFMHFMLSLERMRLNSGLIEKHKKKIETQLEKLIAHEAQAKNRILNQEVDWIFEPGDFLKV